MTDKKNLHLTVSAIVLTIISLSYGVSPHSILPKLFDFKVASVDLKQIFRATMGLYLGMVMLWIIGIFKPFYWRTATISNVFFMGGLAFGRLLSVTLDGIPSIYFLTGFAIELIFGFWGVKNLNKYPLT